MLLTGNMATAEEVRGAFLDDSKLLWRRLTYPERVLCKFRSPGLIENPLKRTFLSRLKTSSVFSTHSLSRTKALNRSHYDL